MTDLFRVTALLNVPGNVLQFTFTNGKRALEAAEAMTTTEQLAAVTVRDDYGTVCTIRRDAITAVNLSEIGRQLEGDSEVAFAQAVKQAELQKKAQTDVRLNSGLVVPATHFAGGRKQ